MYSSIIKNASVIDGTGKPAERLDVAIEKDEIVAVDRSIAASAQTVIDATGKVLCPGFVDIQNHSDSYWQLFDNPRLDSLVSQGYTTILTGHCGSSLAPLLSEEALLTVQKWHTLSGANVNWRTFAEYLQSLSARTYGCNVASLVGYSTLRRGLVGDEVRQLEEGELSALKKILSESLEAGAFGLSSGLAYSHEVSTSATELVELAKTAKEHGALLSVHLRSEGSHVVEALAEALEISRAFDLPLKVSHLKVRGSRNWPRFSQVLEQLETAYHRGVPVHFDTYPYDTVWQVLYSYLPNWAVEGGRTTMLRHLKDQTQRGKILAYLGETAVKFSELLVASTTNQLNFTGKTVGQIAVNLGLSSEETVLHLIENGGSEVMVFERNLEPGQVETLTCHPLAFIATDGGGFPENVAGKLVHPRCFGTAPKFIREATKAGKLTLEQAVQKLTDGPAQKVGLKGRGRIAVGYFADLVLFSESELEAKATYENPYQFSRGIDYVFVNGRPTVSDGRLTDQLAGRVLKKR